MLNGYGVTSVPGGGTLTWLGNAVLNGYCVRENDNTRLLKLQVLCAPELDSLNIIIILMVC